MISPVPPEQPHDGNREPFLKTLIEPTALLAILWRRKLLIVAVMVAGVIAGVLYGKFATAKYESASILLVMPKMPSFADATDSLDAKNFDSLFATHIRLVSSPRVVGMAMKRGQLDELPGIQSRLKGNVDTIEYIKRNLTVSRSGEGDSKGAFVIRVAFRHPFAEEAPVVVEHVVEAYREFLQSSALNGPGQVVELMTRLRQQAADDMAEKNEAYRDFLLKAPGVWNRQTLENSHQRRIDELETELTQAGLRQVKIESRLAMIKQTEQPDARDRYTDLERLALIDDLHVERLSLLVSVKGDVLTEFLQSQYPDRQEHASARYKDMLTIVREAETLRARLGPNHPKVRENEVDIAALENALLKTNKQPLKADGSVAPQELVKAYKVLLENDLIDTTRHVKYLEESVAQEEQLAKRLLDVSLESEMLQQEYERSSEVHAAMLERFREQKLVDEFGEYLTEVLESPKLGEKVWPRTKVLTALGMVFGMFAGILLAIGLDLLAVKPIPPAEPASSPALPSRIR